MASLRPSLRIVLHQVRSPDNLGAVLRLMRNFGLGDLSLSDPATTEFHASARLARRGVDLLDGMRVERTLDDALADCVYACGTTSREAVERRETVTPEEAVQRLLRHAARGKVALVFGGEKRGLSDEELARCQDICVIPTEPAPQPSMNLAQAAAVMLYLASRAGEPERPPAPVPEGARLQAVKALEGRMEEVLRRAEFLNPQAPPYVLEELLQSLHRGAPTQREVELWLGAFRALGRTLSAGNGKPPAG
jgi:tRNA/rRNA methyltransferase